MHREAPRYALRHCAHPVPDTTRHRELKTPRRLHHDAQDITTEHGNVCFPNLRCMLLYLCAYT